MTLSRRRFLGTSLSTLTITALAPAQTWAQLRATENTGADWPMFRGGPNRVASTAEPGPDGTLAAEWVFAGGGKNPSNPVITGDTLYVSGDDDVLWALDRATGAQKWAVAVGPGAYDTGGHSVPAVAEGTLFLGASSGVIFALDAATGSEQWRFETGDVVISPPLVAENVLYVGSNNGFVYALDAATGAVRWQRETGPIQLSAATLGDGSIFIGGADGTFNCLAAADGVVRWTSRTGRKMKTSAYDNGMVFAPSFDGRIYAFDAVTGSQRWASQDFGDVSQANNPAILGDTVVATIDDHGIFAFDAATGAERWSRQDFAGGYSSPVIAGDVVYVSTEDTNLSTLDLATGKTLASFPLGHYAGAPAVAAGMLYIVADDGNVYALAAAPEGVASPVPLPEPIAGTLPTTTPLSQMPVSHLPIVGAFVRAISTGSGPDDPLQGPEGIAFNADGRMYLVDSLTDRIVVYGKDGAYLSSFGKTGTGDGEFAFHNEDGAYWGDLAAGADGSLYVADVFNGRLQKFDSAGGHLVTTSLGKDALAGGIAVDPAAKRVYLSDLGSSRLLVFDLDAAPLGFIGPSQSPLVFADPYGLGIGTNGEILVCELEDGTVPRVDPSGVKVGAIGRKGIADGRFRQPIDAVEDADGTIYVTDYNAAHVQVFANDGTPIGLIGSPGTGDGQFTNPTYLAFGPDGLLYVSDDTAHRVQAFSVLIPA